MSSSSVRSWRPSPRVREQLELRARARGLTVQDLVATIVGEWLESEGATAEQARLRATADAALGTLSGGNPSRSGSVRRIVRAKLPRRTRADGS